MISIVVRFDPDALIPDPTGIDVDASIEAFGDALTVDLRDAVPEADIAVADENRLISPVIVDIVGAADHDQEDAIRSLAAAFAQRIWAEPAIWRRDAPGDGLPYNRSGDRKEPS